jgi:hypothetical protein
MNGWKQFQMENYQPIKRMKNKTQIIKKASPKFSGLKYKSRTKWKMLRGIYSGIYGEVNVSVSVCVEINGDNIEK